MPVDKQNTSEHLKKQREREVAEFLAIMDERCGSDWFDLSRDEKRQIIIEIRKEAKRRCQ